MATDVVSIWNLALSAAGSKSSVSAEDENSRQVNLCRIWYPLVRDMVLKAASWPCAKTYVTLAVSAERADNTDWTDSDPAPTWKYAYAVPSDMLAPRNLSTYARFDRAVLSGANTIVTNQEQAVLHYIMRQEDVTRWDVGLEAAVVFSLAANISMQLNGVRTKAERLLGLAEQQVLIAQTEIANESDDEFEAPASWVAARGYEQAPRHSRFQWPYEELTILAQ